MPIELQADPAVEAAFYPFQSQQLAWPDELPVLFLGARVGPSLLAYAQSGLVFEQSFRPNYDAVLAAGLALADPGHTHYAMIVLLPPRQRDQARAQYVEAFKRLKPGGVLVVSQANTEGAQSCQSDLEQLLGPVNVLSKHKCRVMWTADGYQVDAAVAEQWSAQDQPSAIADGRFVSRPGVFAWDRIDPASRLLAEHLPAGLAGRAADLGAGYGYLASEMLTRCPGVTSIDLYEADARALTLAEQNLARFGNGRPLEFVWHDVCAGLTQTYDCIISNPPFHAQQGHSRPDIGREFLRSAATALVPEGRLWFVANRHLPYEAVLSEGFDEVRQVVQSGAYKIIEAVKASGRKPRAAAPPPRSWQRTR